MADNTVNTVNTVKTVKTQPVAGDPENASTRKIMTFYGCSPEGIKAGEPGSELPSIIGLTKRCSRCGKVKLLDEFYRNSKSIDQHGAWCKSCSNKYRQAAREIYPRKLKAMKATYDAGKGQVVKECSHCHEIRPIDDFYRNSWAKDQYQGWCKSCSNKHRQHYRETHLDREKQVTHERYLRSRDEILIRERDRNQQRKALLVAHYSNNANRCVCCGESDMRFLTIDHINGNGSKHRKSSKCGTGSVFYRWLIKEGMPEGYQALCYNCNLARTWHGKCSHELGRKQ